MLHLTYIFKNTLQPIISKPRGNVIKSQQGVSDEKQHNIYLSWKDLSILKDNASEGTILSKKEEFQRMKFK